MNENFNDYYIGLFKFIGFKLVYNGCYSHRAYLMRYNFVDLTLEVSINNNLNRPIYEYALYNNDKLLFHCHYIKDDSLGYNSSCIYCLSQFNRVLSWYVRNRKIDLVIE